MERVLSPIFPQKMAVQILVNRFHATVSLQIENGKPFDQYTLLRIRDLINVIGLFHLMPELAINLGQLGKDGSNVPFDLRKCISLFLVNLIRLELDPVSRYRTI